MHKNGKKIIPIVSLISFVITIIIITNHDEVKAAPYDVQFSAKNVDLGAWIPSHLYLETIDGDKQVNGINSLLSQGFDEYYFVMQNFSDNVERERTETLLKSADNTNVKIFVILLPMAEGGTHVNYDWKGWMKYFNSLREKHPSFEGFVLDDFNAFVDIRRIILTNNVDLMALSNFSSALSYKRDDVKFYPVMYVETGEFQTLKKQYEQDIEGLMLVSTLYRNISDLERHFDNYSKMFDEKPIKFILYPMKDQSDRASDQLVKATLSVASRWADGIIIYRNTTHPIVQDYLSNHNDHQFMLEMRKAERAQIMQEIIESRRDIPMCTYCLYKNN